MKKKTALLRTQTYIFPLALLAFGYPCKKLHAQNDIEKVTVVKNVYDTITVTEKVVVYDTVWKETLVDEYGISAGAFLFQSNYRNSKTVNVQTEREWGYGGFVGFDVKVNRFSIATGVGFSTFLDRSRFHQKYAIIDTVVDLEINEHNFYEFDTTGSYWEFVYDSTFVNDSLPPIIIDSIFHYIVDSSLVTRYDSTYVTRYDTLSADTLIFRTSSYRYVEIPLILRFTYAEFENATFDLSIGAVLGLRTDSRSYYMTEDFKRIDLIDNKSYYTIYSWIWFSTGAELYLPKSISIRFEPFYMIGLGNLYKNTVNIEKIPDRYGIKAGIRLSF